MQPYGDCTFDRTERLSSVAEVPARFELAQNAPKPFTAGSSTSIRFSLPERSEVRVAVYTVAGQWVRTLAEGSFEAGHRMVEWNGSGPNGRVLAPGMYVRRLEARPEGSGQLVRVRKMLMIK